MGGIKPLLLRFRSLTFTYNHMRSEESVGFEPTELLHSSVFKTDAISLSTNYPVPSNGFEPLFSSPELDVLPLDDKGLLHLHSIRCAGG